MSRGCPLTITVRGNIDPAAIIWVGLFALSCLCNGPLVLSRGDVYAFKFLSTLNRREAKFVLATVELRGQALARVKLESFCCGVPIFHAAGLVA